MSELSKHERRQLKLEEKREAKQRMNEDYRKEKSNKKLIIYAVIGIIIISAIGIFLLLPKPEPVNYETGGLSFPLGNVHWHATPLVYVCGKNIPIPTPIPGKHLGSSLLHTHDDSKAHIEGSVSDPSQITLSAFMSNIGMRFSETELVDKKNGDICTSGLAGEVKMTVNGTENNEFGNYVLRDGDRIELRFE